MYHGSIPGEIVPYVRVGRERHTERAKRYHESRNRLRDELAIAIRGQGAADVAPYMVELHFYRWRQTGDIDNLAKGFLDSANGVLWADDRQVSELHVYRYKAAKGDDRVNFIVASAQGGE